MEATRSRSSSAASSTRGSSSRPAATRISASSCRCASELAARSHRALDARAFRNLAPVSLEPRERFNVFVGDNGQGKTNLLEAIYASRRCAVVSRARKLDGHGRVRRRAGAACGARVVKLHD